MKTPQGKPKALKSFLNVSAGAVELVNDNPPVQTHTNSGVHHVSNPPQDLKGLDAHRYSPVCKTVFLCRSGTRSVQAVQKIRSDAGCTIYSLEGGVTAWQAQGPGHSSSCMSISIERQVNLCAGLLIVVGSVAAIELHQVFLVIPLFLGLSLAYSGLTEKCEIAPLLRKLPWNN